MKKVVELSLNIVIHLKVDGDGTSSALEYVGRRCWAEGPSIKDVGNSEYVKSLTSETKPLATQIYQKVLQN